MPRVEEAARAQPLHRRERMAAPHEAGVVDGPQRARADGGRLLRLVDIDAEHAINAIVFELVGDLHNGVGNGVDSRLGRDLAEMVQQVRHHQRGDVIRHRQAELCLRTVRVEHLLVERAADGFERFADRLPQHHGALGRTDAGAGPDEQGIAERVPQTCERVADRRLRHQKRVGGARDAALGHQGLEDFQQVEVELSERQNIHHSDVLDHDYKL
ncbi:hypothetical protein ACVWWO_001419 [Bradyrhizobium sp. F1.13.1]